MGYRSCTCESVAIDGGLDYVQITGYPTQWKQLKIDVDVTEEELLKDWGSKENRFGLIPQNNLCK